MEKFNCPLGINVHCYNKRTNSVFKILWKSVKYKGFHPVISPSFNTELWTIQDFLPRASDPGEDLLQHICSNKIKSTDCNRGGWFMKHKRGEIIIYLHNKQLLLGFFTINVTFSQQQLLKRCLSTSVIHRHTTKKNVSLSNEMHSQGRLSAS